MNKPKGNHTVRTELDEWGRRKFHLEEASPDEESPAEAKAVV